MTSIRNSNKLLWQRHLVLLEQPRRVGNGLKAWKPGSGRVVVNILPGERLLLHSLRLNFRDERKTETLADYLTESLPWCLHSPMCSPSGFTVIGAVLNPTELYRSCQPPVRGEHWPTDQIIEQIDPAHGGDRSLGEMLRSNRYAPLLARR